MRKRLRKNKVEEEHIIPPVNIPALVFWRLKYISSGETLGLSSLPCLCLFQGPQALRNSSAKNDTHFSSHTLPRMATQLAPRPSWPRVGMRGQEIAHSDACKVMAEGRWGSGHKARDACHQMCYVSRLTSECLAPSFSRLWSLEKERPGDRGGVSVDGWPIKVRPVFWFVTSASWSADTLASLCLAHLLPGTERLCSAIHQGAQKAFWNHEPEHLCPSLLQLFVLDVFVMLMMKVTIPCLEASRDPGMFHNRMMYGAFIIRIRYLRGCQMCAFTKVKFLIGRLYFESSWERERGWTLNK